VPRTRRRGFELSAEYASETWLAYASWSHLKATYRFDGDLPSPNSPFADDDGDVQVSPGDRIGGVPGDRFKAGADFAATPQITIGGDVVGISSQYLVGDEGNQADKLRGYWTANLHASWQVAKAVQVYGRVDNLFNSHRATYGTYFETESTENVHPSPLPDDADPRTVTPLYPRTFLVGVRLSW
jgi:iron complex outermembrane receptor protein